MIFGVKIFFIRIIQISGNQISLHCRNLPEQPYIFCQRTAADSVKKIKISGKILQVSVNITQLAAYRQVPEIIRSEKTEVFAKAPIFRCFKVYRWQVGLI